MLKTLLKGYGLQILPWVVFAWDYSFSPFFLWPLMPQHREPITGNTSKLSQHLQCKSVLVYQHLLSGWGLLCSIQVEARGQSDLRGPACSKIVFVVHYNGKNLIWDYREAFQVAPRTSDGYRLVRFQMLTLALSICLYWAKHAAQLFIMHTVCLRMASLPLQARYIRNNKQGSSCRSKSCNACWSFPAPELWKE